MSVYQPGKVDWEGKQKGGGKGGVREEDEKSFFYMKSRCGFTFDDKSYSMNFVFYPFTFKYFFARKLQQAYIDP